MVSFETFINCFLSVIFGSYVSFAYPLNNNTETESHVELQREPKQVHFERRPDGTMAASFAMANAIDTPLFDNAFAMSESFEIGPQGFSSSGATAFDSNMLGNKMSFANSQAQNSRFGGGMSSANAMSNSFSNPLFSGSNSNANSFASSLGNMLFK